ncbi:MAG: outer membrane protein assembly factor BamA [Bacteroidetes bacterium]|nr:MAG: outer membrane protein assembly factor BamA [Bacteroidota bacterium]
MMNKYLVLLISCCMLVLQAQAQFDYKNPKTYIVAKVEVKGAQFSDEDAIIAMTGFTVGSTVVIPGDQIADAIKKLWQENIFSDINIRADEVNDQAISLIIEVRERPRISSFSFEGISKSHADDLREKINFIRGTILTESKRQTASRIIRNFYVEKGFFNTTVQIRTETDKVIQNGVIVTIEVNKGKKIKIKDIIINGNEAFSDKKIIKKLKKVHEKTWWRFWARSKYVPKEYNEAKAALMEYLNDEGYRDALIERDTVYAIDDKHVNVEIDLYEGIQYYFRNITWSGNFKYNSEQLSRVLNIKKGDVYSTTQLNKRLSGDPNGGDVSSLYLDDGYLFYNVEPVEVAIEGDSIDLELRMTEGPQATNRKIIVEGNTKTSDYVVLRELRTTPGEKFRRSEIIRSQREILALGFFDQEKMNIQPIPNIETGTVDLKYTVEERPSDQLQLQGGWGGRIRDFQGNIIAGGFVGTVQLAFNNFAAKRILDPKAWRPVPSGDGQKLSLAFQMNGVGYKNFSVSFQEPWLGGKKPNSLGVSGSYYVFQSVRSDYRNAIFSTSVDFGQRLKFPDDFFRSFTSVGYKYYDVTNPSVIFRSSFSRVVDGSVVYEPQAYINIITLRQTFERSSIDAPIFPRSGSLMSLSVEATPPYSLFRENENYEGMTDAEKFRFLEYHKWKFNSNWFFRIVGNKLPLVLSVKIEAGYLGMYNKRLGVSPFERFFMGGSGLLGQTFGLDGRELIPLRGYEDGSLDNENSGYPIYNRFVAELRFPVTLNQSAPVWLQAFAEAGNGWQDFRTYNPFDLKRSLGAGVRVMLPMVGLLGLDWAYGFDRVLPSDASISGSQFHFIIGQSF